MYDQTQNTLADGATVSDLRQYLAQHYDDESFVHVLSEGVALPQPRHLRASSLCVVQTVAYRVPNRATIVSAIDNFVKGAYGRAIQNMNLMLNFLRIKACLTRLTSLESIES